MRIRTWKVGMCKKKLELSAEPKKTWANFFETNRLPAKGMGLSYLAPIIRNGEKVVELNKDVVNKAIEE